MTVWLKLKCGAIFSRCKCLLFKVNFVLLHSCLNKKYISTEKQCLYRYICSFCLLPALKCVTIYVVMCNKNVDIKKIHLSKYLKVFPVVEFCWSYWTQCFHNLSLDVILVEPRLLQREKTSAGAVAVSCLAWHERIFPRLRKAKLFSSPHCFLLLSFSVVLWEVGQSDELGPGKAVRVQRSWLFSGETVVIKLNAYMCMCICMSACDINTPKRDSE